MGSMIELQSADGYRLGAYRAVPAGLPRAGVVIVQEVFGVNEHIRSVADGYAADGYVAIAPAMYDRVHRGYESGYSQPEIAAGVAIMQKLDWKQTMLDVQSAISEAAGSGKVGIVGYCWGGTVAWVAAARIAGLAAAVAYYPGGIANFAGESPKCPVLCHFGNRDTSPTPTQAKAVVAEYPSVTAHFYDAGHGFNCDHRPSYSAESARLARARTLEFLRAQLS